MYAIILNDFGLIEYCHIDEEEEFPCNQNNMV